MSKINKITPLTHVKFLNLYELEAENKFGDTHPYYVASRKDEETMMAATKKVIPDGVVIYSLFGEKADKLIMVKQFRYPLNDYTYELPAGLIDPGESVKETAIREMMEELKISREQIRMIAQMDTLYTAYDNKVSLGGGYARWKQIYAKNTSISTSDRNLKQYARPYRYGI